MLIATGYLKTKLLYKVSSCSFNLIVVLLIVKYFIMKKVLFALTFVGVLASCQPVKTELEHYESNKATVEKEYPNYHITSFRQYSYVFQVSNPEHVIKVTLDGDAKIIKRDTLKVFTSLAKR